MSNKIRLFSYEKKDLTKAILKLKKSQLLTAYVRLPTIKKIYTVRTSPVGKGYSTFKKYTLKLHKGVVFFNNIDFLKKAIPLIKIPNLFTEVELT